MGHIKQNRCKYFALGKCSYGANCKFSHAGTNPMQTNASQSNSSNWAPSNGNSSSSWGVANKPSLNSWGDMTNSWGNTNARQPTGSWGNANASQPSNYWGNTNASQPSNSWGNTNANQPSNSWGNTSASQPSNPWGNTSASQPPNSNASHSLTWGSASSTSSNPWGNSFPQESTSNLSLDSWGSGGNPNSWKMSDQDTNSSNWFTSSGSHGVNHEWSGWSSNPKSMGSSAKASDLNSWISPSWNSSTNNASTWGTLSSWNISGTQQTPSFSNTSNTNDMMEDDVSVAPATPFIASSSNETSNTDRAQYQAQEFSLFQIPLAPPTPDLC